VKKLGRNEQNQNLGKELGYATWFPSRVSCLLLHLGRLASSSSSYRQLSTVSFLACAVTETGGGKVTGSERRD